MRTSGTKGTEATAGMLATAGTQSTAGTQTTAVRPATTVKANSSRDARHQHLVSFREKLVKTAKIREKLVNE